MRKADFCLCENKGADQLRSNCKADQCLCFRCTVGNPEAWFSHVVAQIVYILLFWVIQMCHFFVFCCMYIDLIRAGPIHRLAVYFALYCAICFSFEPVREKNNNLGFLPGPTNQPVQSQKIARSLKFRMKEEEGLY